MPLINIEGFSSIASDERWIYEKHAFNNGFKMIAGIDEAGRGPLAGPVVAACVILPENCWGLETLDDSKKLTSLQRQKLFSRLQEMKAHIGIGIIDAEIIDEINILQATFLAMHNAYRNNPGNPDYLLIDGNQRPPWMKFGETIIAGDARSLSIAAASIIAKVTRDQLMSDYNEIYPQWGFDKHKGYGTVAHMRAIREHGVCKIHRKSFSPINQFPFCPI